ncbi:MAG: hypothetical protein H0T83_04715 [Chthoniobacterales bacterium]|nr:hypothetical protein [Chthoniobacterales bacterium]
MYSLRSFVLVLVLVLVLPAASRAADPVSEMAEFSVFGNVDLNELGKGEIKTAAGSPMSNPRHLSVQSCFIVPQPPDRVLAAMKRFDPTAQRELKVYLHSDLPASPSAANFSKLNNPPENGAVKSLRAATEKMSPGLQLSQAEAKGYSSGQPAFAFWSEVLEKRAQAFVSGGAASEAPYDHTRSGVQPGKELTELVRQQGKVSHQFGGFLGATGLLGGKGSLRPELYWELLEVEDEGVLTLGASYSRSTKGGGAQVADGLYYASGGYNVALTLYQLWPVEVGGRPSTLVWRGDFISADSLGDLHGIERLASESAMRKDILNAATIFQRDTGE